MKKILIISLLLIWGLIGCAGKEIVPVGELQKMIVAFDWDAEVQGVLDKLEANGIAPIDRLDIVSAVTCYLTPQQAELLKSILPIRYIEVDAEVFALPIQTQKNIVLTYENLDWGAKRMRVDTAWETVVPTYENIDWGAKRIHADTAWEIATGKGIRIGVIDTGIKTDHPDLVGAVKGGFNAINGGSYEDDNNHGTYVATVIAARKNDVGIVGIAPDADLYAIKVLNSSGSGNYSSIVKGYEWALSQELDVVNMSLGGYSTSQALEEAMIIAAFQGMATVCAAGNDGRKGLCYPARYSIAVPVGATGYDDTRMEWSNYGYSVSLDSGDQSMNLVMAPGDWILAGNKDGEWSRVAGTSIAAPMVTGTIALLLEMKWCDRRFLFASGTHPIEPTETEGFGMIDVRKALEIMIKEYWDNVAEGQVIGDDEQFRKMIQGGLKIGLGL